MQNKDVILIHAQLMHQICLRFQMTILTMYRNGIPRLYQRIDQFNLFLSGMSGYMRIFKYNICTFGIQFVDHLGNRFFISRNRI